MPKHDAKGRSKGDGPHVRLYRYLTRSEAWRALDCVARCAYLELAERYNGKNNGSIVLSTRQLTTALGVGNDTAVRVLRTLEENGFIVCTFKGGFSQKTGDRRASEWRLTDHYCDATSTPASKDFMRRKFNNAVRPQEPDGSATGTERFDHRNRDLQNGAEKSRSGSATGTANASSGSATGAHIVNQGDAPTCRASPACSRASGHRQVGALQQKQNHK